MAQNCSKIIKRLFSNTKCLRLPKHECNFDSHRYVKVTIVGGMGNTGKPLALMLKQSPLIDELCIYDIKPVNSFVHELGHIDTMCKITGYTGKLNLDKALNNSKVVVLLASVMESDPKNYIQQFEQNAPLVQCMTEFIATCCSKALIAVVTNPVNSIVPLVSEVLKKKGAYSPNTVFGVTTIDCVRTNTLAAAALHIDPECVVVPVIGGHSETTMIPVLSAAKPCSVFTSEVVEKITKSVRKGTINVAKLKPAIGDSLSGAFSTARFIVSLVKGLRGYQNIEECAYVRSKAHPQLKYMATPLLLGPAGITRNLGIPKLTDYENCLLDNSIAIIAKDIRRGEKFLGVDDPPICNMCEAEMS